MPEDLKALPSVPATQYIDAIAQHVSSVCIVAAEWEGARYGLTATAVCSVSAEPPRLLVCVNKSGYAHDKILAAGCFCVNVLTEEQDRAAMVFAGMGGPDADRFGVGEWTRMKTGAPALVGAAAAFDCVLGETHDQASHTVLFGDVVATAHGVGRDTLLYGARRFRRLRKVFAAPGGSYNEYL